MQLVERRLVATVARSARAGEIFCGDLTHPAIDQGSIEEQHLVR
jgi:hypothetical protein